MVPMQRKILAFDGGPSPVISIRILKKIEAQFPGFLDRVDLFAGTSHGGIISLKLATLLSDGVPADRAIDECIEFDNEFLQLLKLTPTSVLRMLSGVVPMVSTRGMLGFLEKHFTGRDGKPLRLCDLRKPVTISAFDLNTGQLRTAHSYAPDAAHYTLLSAALACSSFPVVMPLFKPAFDELPIVDGGFGANSGAMPALSDSLKNMGTLHPGAQAGDFLPYITLLSMGCISKDRALKVPLFEPIAQLAEKLGLFGREQKVQGGGVLRNVGWWFLLRSNIKAALTLLENTQALDRRYADNLLDDERYCRMAPELEVLEFFRRLVSDPEATLRETDALAAEYWSAQMKQYKTWKEAPRPQSNPKLRKSNDFACWLDWYWMQELSPRPDQHEVKLRSMALDPRMRLDTFDASAQPGLPQKELAQLGTCHFVEEARNVLLVGPSGAGKSHLAQALGNEAVSRGHKVLYMPAARMLEQLAAARAAGAYDQKLAELAGVDLLILEDLGLKPMKADGEGDFYDVVSERAGKKALLVTSSLPPAEWAGRFGDPVLADAILTRLRTGCREIALTGENPSAEGKPRQAASRA
ncbi:ATP-binding protein [Archangium gephyra]|uniref:ATP-binding protein n=1 Tax=Archangium gephyra TaxID=48 RepID=UPI0035D4F699